MYLIALKHQGTAGRKIENPETQMTIDTTPSPPQHQVQKKMFESICR